MPKPNRVTILQHEPRWRGMKAAVERAARAALAHQRVRGAAVTIVLADDAEVRELNATYRKKNKPTNVLSFPDGSVEAGITQLGDIILAYETCVAEARAQGKHQKDHVTHLVVHGILHVLGYDHMSEGEAEAMEAIEIKILSRMGIANPYETA